MMHELNVKLLESVCIEMTTLLRRQLYWLQIIFRRESRILIAEEHINMLVEKTFEKFVRVHIRISLYSQYWLYLYRKDRLVRNDF